MTRKAMVNPLGGVSDAMRRATDPLAGMSEAMRRATDPLMGMSEATRKAITDPLGGVSEAVRRATDPLMGMSEATRKAITDPLGGVSEAMRRATDPLMGISEGLRSTIMGLDAVSLGASRALANLRIQNEVLATAMAGPSLKAFSLPLVLEAWSDPFGANFQAMVLASRTLAEAIKVHEQLRLKNATTTIKTHSLLLDSLAVIEEETVNGVAPSALNQIIPRLFSLFMERIESAGSIFEQQRLMGIITILSFLLMFYFEAQGDNEHQEVMDALALLPAQTQAIENLHGDWKEYANGGQRALAVIMRRANLRRSPDTKGERIALLHEAEVVEFLELSNGWAKVRYFDAVADVVLEGWVYARLIRVVPRD